MAKFKPQNTDELKALVDDESVYLGDIDTSEITFMTSLFQKSQRRDFRGIETWDTSNVVNMFGMFNDAIYFNHDISTWDTSSVVNMFGMFNGARSFNQNIDSWDTSRVEFMTAMFFNAKSFNQKLSSWDVSSVRDNQMMFWESGISAVPMWYKKRVLYDFKSEFELLNNEIAISVVKAVAHPLSKEEKQRKKQERQKRKQKSLLSKVIIGFVLILIAIYIFTDTDKTQNEVVSNSQPKTQSPIQQSEKRVLENSQRTNVVSENKPNLQRELKTPTNETKAQASAVNETTNEAQAQSINANSSQSRVKPSFDCSKASTNAEKLVCSDDELAILDLKLANAYKNARNSADAAGKKKILEEQKIWLKAYNFCNDKDCVKQNLEQRIQALN